MPRVLALISFVAALPVSAQSRTPAESRLSNALPAGPKVTQLVISSDTQRVYYTDSARALWIYSRSAKSTTRLADGEIWDLTISPADNALAYRRVERESASQYIWVLPINRSTGLPTSGERRASALEGDSPSISPDGTRLAFAHDDSIGVGQSVVVVPIAGGRERTLVPMLKTSISQVRWSPDGRSLSYGVNPPVECIPDWSCLPLKPQFQRLFGSIDRVPATGGRSTTVATRVARGIPGLSPDGTRLAYTDTGFPQRLVVADSSGRVVTSFPMPPRQTVEAWMAPATLVFSDRGDVRQLLAYSIADGTKRVLADTMQQLADPSPSPNGQLISTVHCSAPDRCEMHLTAMDGSLRRSISLPDQFSGNAAWSPDGNWLAYIGGPNNARRLDVIEVASGRVRQLSALGAVSAISPRWSGDSHAVILSITAGAGPQRRISFRRVGIDGQSRMLREFIVGPPPSGGYAVSDSSAFVLRDGAVHRLVFDGDSSDVLVGASLGGGGRYSAVTVSPEGNRVAFRRSLEPDGDFRAIDVLGAAGEKIASIDVPFGIFSGPNAIRLLPGGSQLLVYGVPGDSDPDCGIYLIDISTKLIKKLVSVPIASTTAELSVSQDGRTLFYMLAGTTSPRVFTMDLSRLEARK
jgi:Tol biopolymer transport system component